MKKVLGVVLALCVVCIPMRIQAEDSYCFEYGQSLPFDESYVYYDLDLEESLLDTPSNVGRYMAYNYNTEETIEFEIVPKVVDVRVLYNTEEDPYVFEYDGVYHFNTSIDTLGNFVAYGADCMNYKFQYSPSNIRDVVKPKKIVSHEDMEVVYSEKGLQIYSAYEDIEPIELQDVGEYDVCFKGDESIYDFQSFHVRIVPKTKEIHVVLQKHTGEKDPDFENQDYVLSREPGEDLKDYKLFVTSKNKNYTYVVSKESVFRILEKEDLEVKGVDEEKKIDVASSLNENRDTFHNKETKDTKKVDSNISKMNTSLEISLYKNIFGVVWSGVLFVLLRKNMHS